MDNVDNVCMSTLSTGSNLQLLFHFAIFEKYFKKLQRGRGMSALAMFKELYDKGSKSLEIFRQQAVSPNNKKVLKEWGISDAAKMIGRTPQNLRSLETQGKIKKARTKKNGKRTERIYNLKEINKIRDYLNLRPSKPKGAKTAIIGITNFKGGVGKSYTSLTLSQSFALMGYKVLLIDSDNQGTSTYLGGGFIPDLDIRSEQTLLNIITGETKDLANSIIPTHWDGLDIIPANLTLYNAEMVVPNQIYEHRQKTGELFPFYARLKDALNSVEHNYDIIILDTPPSLGFITVNVLFAVDGLIIPLLASGVDYCSTIQFASMAYETLDRLPKIDYQFIRLLLNKNKPYSAQSKDISDFIKKFFGELLLTNSMIDTEAVSKATANMQTILEAEIHPNDRKTFNRALSNIDEVTKEVEFLIKQVWDSAQYREAA